MQHLNRRQALAVIGACGAGPLAGLAYAQAQAQPQPDLARLVTGFAAGGTTDLIARRLSAAMSGHYAKTVIVENRTGAATRIGIEFVKNAPPDGNTALVTPTGMMFMYPHIYEKLGYDYFKDFAPVTAVATTGFGLAVGPAVPAEVGNLAQYVAWCKAHPKQAAYGSPASGSMPHLMMEAFKQRLGLDIVHTGYRGSGPAVLDLVGGQIPAVTSGLGDFLPYIADRKLRVIATAGPRRHKNVPDTATFQEQGIDNFVFQEDYAVFVPARTPKEAVDRLCRQIHAALAQAGVVETLQKSGLEPNPITPEQLGAVVKTEYERWGPIVKAVGFKAEG